MRSKQKKNAHLKSRSCPTIRQATTRVLCPCWTGKTWGQGHGPNATQVRGQQECDWHLPSEAWTVFDERAGDESWEAVLLDQGAEGELEEPGHGME